MGFWFVTIPLGLSVLSVFFLVPEVRLWVAKFRVLTDETLLRRHMIARTKMKIWRRHLVIVMKGLVPSKNTVLTKIPQSLISTHHLRLDLRRDQVISHNSRYGAEHIVMWMSSRSLYAPSHSFSRQWYVDTNLPCVVLLIDCSRRGTYFSFTECRPSGSVSDLKHVNYDQSTDCYPGLLPICSSTIFTLEYNFTASQIVRHFRSSISSTQVNHAGAN